VLLALPFLPVREDFHPKRNQARQKLATLPASRFEDLSSDVYFELARRYPEFKEDVRPDLVSAPMIAHSNNSPLAAERLRTLDTTTTPLPTTQQTRIAQLAHEHRAGCQLNALLTAGMIQCPVESHRRDGGRVRTCLRLGVAKRTTDGPRMVLSLLHGSGMKHSLQTWRPGASPRKIQPAEDPKIESASSSGGPALQLASVLRAKVQLCHKLKARLLVVG